MDEDIFETESIFVGVITFDIDRDLWQNPGFVPKPCKFGIVFEHPVHFNGEITFLRHVLFGV